MKHSFLEKKSCKKAKMDSLWTPGNITPLEGSCYEAIDTLISHTQKLYFKMFRTQCRKNITVEDNKKRINLATLMNIYTNIYIYITCDENE